MKRKFTFLFLVTFLTGFTFVCSFVYGQNNVSYSPAAYYLHGQAITTLNPTQAGVNINGGVFSYVTHFAGSGANGSTDNSNPLLASFSNPRSIVKDAHGNYYIADIDAKKVRRIAANGSVSTVYSFTSFQPRDLVIHPVTGHMYILISTHRIVMLTNTNAANYSTQAPAYTYAGDSNGGIIVGSSTAGSTDGTGTSARLDDPWGLTISPDNTYLVVADFGGGRIRKVLLSNYQVSTLATGLSGPVDALVQANGDIIFAEYSGNKIRKLSGSTVTTIAGASTDPGIGNNDGSTPLNSWIDKPHSITMDAIGNIYVAEMTNHKIRKIATDGSVSTLAGTLWWSNWYGDVSNVTSTSARFDNPRGIFYDPDLGYLLVADATNRKIKKINVEGFEIIPAPVAGLTFNAANGQLSGTPTSYTLASQYINSYNSNSLGATAGGAVTLTGHAYWSGDMIYLNPRLSSRLGGMTIPATGINSPLLNVSFDLITSTDAGADGMSYSFAPDASSIATSPAAEVGTGSKLSISFAAYGSSKGIRVFYNPAAGSSLATSPNSTMLAYVNNTSWFAKRAKIVVDVDANGKLTLSMDGVVLISNLQLPAGYLTEDKSTWKHVFKSRTGASYDLYAIDNVAILQGYGTTTHKVIAREYNLYQEVNLAVNVPVLPSLTTTSVSSITTSGAAVNYTVNSLGSSTISGSGIVWGSTTAPTLSSNLGSASSGSTSTGSQTSNITGLDDETTYYVRSYVTTTLGHTVYGNEISFETLLAVPEISYNQTNSLVLGVAMSPLLVTNSGGVVVAGNSGVVSTIAGSGVEGGTNGMSTAAQFKSPEYIVIDSQGNKFISEGWGHRIRKITPDGTVSTFVGSTQGDALGTGTAAQFNYPTNMAIDANDNIFVVDYSNGKIKKITPAGVVTTFASGLFTPAGMVFDAAGNLVVVDRQAHIIRKYTPQGVASVFVGSGTSGTNNGTGAAAQFNYPSSIVKDANDNFYVAEYNRIRKITAQGVVTTLAGGTTYGTANGTGTAAGFGYINGLAISPDGDLYASESSRIRKITPAGVVTTYIGNSWGYLDGSLDVALFKTPYGLEFDQNGNLIVVDRNDYRIRQIAPPTIGSFTVSPTLPAGLTLNSNGSISGTPLVASAATNYTVTATNSAGSDSYTLSIEVLTTPTVVTNILSNATPSSVVAGGNVITDGNATLTERGVCWSTTPLPTIANTTVVATSTTTGSFSVDITGLSANQTYYLRAYATNTVGTSYGAQVVYNTTTLASPDISYTATNVLDLQVATTISVTNIGGAVPSSNSPIIPIIAGSTSGNVDATGENAKFGYLTGIDIDNDGNIIVADLDNNQIKKITPSGVVTTIAGTGVHGSLDGAAASASFDSPYDVAVDINGNIYVSDMGNHRIRKISPAGIVSTIAGGTAGNVNGIGTAAKFYYPKGIDVDENGNIYVADEYNHSIRKVTPQGVVSTIAGSGSYGYQDGTGTAAKFSLPSDVSLDPSGTIFVTDYSNHRIRKVTQDGVVTTFAGNSSIGYANGTGTAASFYYPQGLKVDDFGNIYVSEYYSNGFRIISSSAVVSSISSCLNNSCNGYFNNANGVHIALGLTFDNSGNLIFTEGGSLYPKVKKMLPINTGSWSISPALPAGLTLGTNGNITGTPLITSPATDYTVTATNSSGSDTYTLNIEVTGPSNDQIDLTASTSNITEETVAVSATLSTGGSVVVLQNDPYHLVSYGSTANLGTIYQITLTGQITSGTVWGTNNIYTHDSRISKAAVHAGILDDGETGTVYVQLTPGLPSYGASTENGVTTYTWPSWPYTYSFVNAPSSPNTLPVTAKGFVYATTAAPELGGQGVQSVAITTGTTIYNTTLSGLTPGQTYYIRAYATNASGTYYSDEQVITTADITYANVNVTYGALPVNIQVPTGVGTSSITYSSSNPGVVSVTSSTMSFGNAGTAIITATQAAYGSYGAITNTFNVTVEKADQDLSLNLYMGGTSLPQTAALSTLTMANAMEIQVTSKFLQWGNYVATGLEPTLSMSLTGLTADLNNFTIANYYTFGSVVASGAGSVTFTLTHPGNSNFNPATITHTMDITNDIGVITFNQPGALTYPVSLGVDLTGYATSTSAAQIVYSVVSGPGTISNNVLTVTGAGTIVIQAAQPSVNTVPVSQSLVINKGVPVYTFANMTKTYGDADFTPSYVSSSDGTVTFSSSNSNVATTGGSVIDVLNAGNTTITLSQTEGTNYVAAAATATLTVNKASQTISYTSVSPITTYDFYFNPIVLPTESSAGLPLTYSTSAFNGFSYGSQGPIGSISSNLLSFDETAFINGNYTGSVMLTISQAGNDNYLAAEVTENISVSRIQSVITATDLSTTNAQIGGAVPYTATTNASFPGHTYPISVASSNTNVATYNASTGMIEIIGTGTTWITATHMADAYYTTGMHTQLLTVSALSTPTISASTQYPCAGQTLQDLNVQTNIGLAILKWYDAATGGNELLPSELVSNGTVWVAQYSNGQESSRSAITMIITDISSSNLSSISGSSTAVAGTPLVLSVAQINGATSYIWDLPAGLTIASSSNNGATVSITVANGYATGIVKVKAVNSCSETAWQTKTVNAPGQAGISITTTQGGAPVICGGASNVPFSVTSATGATYAWTLPTGLSFASGYDGDEQTTYVNFAAGYVGGAITCVRTTATATNTASYNVGGVATPGSISGMTVLCDETTETYSIGSVPNATSYEWQLPTGMSGTSTTNSITATWTGIVSGTVKVRAIGTCGTSAWRTLSVGAVATPSAISGPTMICGAATYTITGNTMTQVSQTTLNYSVTNVSGMNYAWTVPTGMTITSGGTTNAIVVEVDPTTFTSGQVSVTATSQTSFTCVSSARTLTVTKSVASITGPTAICGLASATYSVPAGSGSAYTWTLPSWMTPATGYTLTSNPIQVDIAATGTSTQSISVEIETSCGDVTVSRSVGCGLYTQLSSASCGAAVSSLSAGISANNIVGAQGYKFQIAIPSQSATTYYYVESSDRWFALSEATSMPQLYGTTYSIRVSLDLGNSWGDYGAACTVSTPALPTTTLSNASCGASLSSISTGISSNNVQGATMYRFTITPNGSQTSYEVDSPDRWFALTEATGMPLLYGTTYSITVTLENGTGVWGTAGAACTVTTPTLPTTMLSQTSCGATLTSLSAGISANNVQSAAQYRFTITPSGSQSSYEVNSPDRWIALTEATGMPLLYGTTYSIVVAVQNGTGDWSNDGTACTVTTPSLPTTALSNSSCGATLTSLSSGISANNVPSAAQYRFTITPVIANATSYEVNSPDRWIALTEATGMPLLYGTSYSIVVAVQNGTGDWSNDGTACTVTTPSLPTTMLSANTSCGATLTSLSAGISANNVQGATMYEFHITDGATLFEYTIQSPDRWIALSEGQSVGQTPQALVPTWDNVYTIKVKVQSGSAWSAYGTECFVNTAYQGLAQQDPQLHEAQTEGIQSEEQAATNDNNTVNETAANITETAATTTWTATATSNPFVHSFQIKLNGAEGISTAASFTAQLTDMSGKVYSHATLSKEQLEAESFGEQLAPGMYLMTLRQGEELRVIRVMKR